MTEQQTPVMTPPAAPPAAPTGPKKKRKGRGKTIAGILIVAAIAIALVVLVWYFVFREDGSKGEVMTDFVTRGSIQSMVEGSGTSKAKDSATVTPGSGTILELFVQEGDQVTAGQQLYRMDDTTARDAVTEAQKSVDNCNKELQAVYDKIAELSITAPHAGNLREVADLKVGDTVKEGDTIATLVNDTKLRLSLYYSYAYEGDIKVGQTAQISIPAIMAPVTGKVEQINKVRFVSPRAPLTSRWCWCWTTPAPSPRGWTPPPASPPPTAPPSTPTRTESWSITSPPRSPPRPPARWSASAYSTTAT